MRMKEYKLRGRKDVFIKPVDKSDNILFEHCAFILPMPAAMGNGLFRMLCAHGVRYMSIEGLMSGKTRFMGRRGV